MQTYNKVKMLGKILHYEEERQDKVQLTSSFKVAGAFLL